MVFVHLLWFVKKKEKFIFLNVRCSGVFTVLKFRYYIGASIKNLAARGMYRSHFFCAAVQQPSQRQYFSACCETDEHCEYESSSWLLPAPNVSHAHDRWCPILASHIHRGKHRRCVCNSTGWLRSSVKTSGILSHPRKGGKMVFKLFFSGVQLKFSKEKQPGLCSIISQQLELLVCFCYSQTLLGGNC